MAESKFIRSLTLAVAVAKASGEDVSESLRSRAAVEDNPVREGILRLMADKRFLQSVSPVMMWKEDATVALEEFADTLESEKKAGRLNEQTLAGLIEDFFSLWSMMMQNRKPVYEASRKARKKAKMGSVGQKGQKEGGPGEKGGRGYSSADTDKALSQFIESEKSEENDEAEGMGMGSGDPKMEQQKRENVFLKSIPESLKKLAMLIGRAGEDDIAAKGRFLTASKSDIEGITVGNNLSALLPSEVALLSDRATQDIFYRNYAERRLQVFASASQSSRPNTHQDGPVIICVDESSSMTGEPLRTAITLTYAVTIIAKRRHRQVLIVAYSDSHKVMHVESLGRQRRQLLEFLSNVSMGGNDENAMFEWLFREILPREEKFKTADILCISDFGWVGIEQFVKKLIEEQKAAGMRFYGLNIGGVFGGWKDLDEDMWDGGSSPMAVCDSVWEYHKGVCKEVKGIAASKPRNKKH